MLNTLKLIISRFVYESIIEEKISVCYLRIVLKEFII